MHIVKELADNLEYYIHQHFNNIAPFGVYTYIDKERLEELKLVEKAREWLKDQGEQE